MSKVKKIQLRNLETTLRPCHQKSEVHMFMDTCFFTILSVKKRQYQPSIVTPPSTSLISPVAKLDKSEA